ncbi:MAG: glycosyltransferase family 9 protein [Candidatus Omnitrophica bacterium]|nr:glycosyltransferase family 9 protein [Candidatus Omnitrophota bacterium]
MDLRKYTGQIKSRPIRRLARLMRKIAFHVMNFFGAILFFLLRLVRIIPFPQNLEKDKIHKILIARPDMIGDVVLATPLIKACRDNFPDAHIAMLVSELTKDLVLKNPYLDEVIVTKGIGIKNLIRDRDTIKSIRKERFDLAFVLFSAFSCNLFVFLSGVTHRIGYGDRGSKFLLTKSLSRDDLQLDIVHNIDLNLNLLKAIGGKVESKQLYVSVYGESEARASSFFQEHGLGVSDMVVLIHPGSRKKYQRWPVSSFSKLADRLIDELKAKIILLSGPLDGEVVKSVVSQMRNYPVVASGLGLRDAISLIKKCDLYIGHSTGTTHIADALGKTAIMIMGFLKSWDGPGAWGLTHHGSINVFKDIGCPYCVPSECRNYPCLSEIKVEEVFDAAKQQIDKIKK